MARKLLGIALVMLLAPAAFAVTRLNVQAASKSGITPTRHVVASTETYKVRNDGKTFLLFEKTSAGACTVTIITPGTANGLAIADQTVTVAATVGDVVIGPMPRGIFNDASADFTFTLSDTLGLTVAVIRL